jgi:hypothetical protein
VGERAEDYKRHGDTDGADEEERSSSDTIDKEASGQVTEYGDHVPESGKQNGNRARDSETCVRYAMSLDGFLPSRGGLAVTYRYI